MAEPLKHRNKMSKMFLVSMVLFAGCYSNRTATPLRFISPVRCKNIHTVGNEQVIIVIRRNCLVNGLTTAMIVVLDTKTENHKLVAETGTRLLITTLGFIPSLSLIVAGEIPIGSEKGIMYLFAITGAVEYLPLVETNSR